MIPEVDQATEERLGPAPLSVVVLSCGPLGFEVAGRLVEVAGVRAVTLITTPYHTRDTSLWKKIRNTWRMDGPLALPRTAVHRVIRAVRGGNDPHAPGPRIPLDCRVRHLSFTDFHDPECVAALRALGPDLGVVAGTYILEESVYEIPRRGCINLHSGKVPEYRGAAPAFWELYNGETAVGITIHEVVRKVDSGAVYRQELFPLDPAPAGDPLDYIDRYRREVLRPNGVRMLVETIAAIADGRAEPMPQDDAQGRTYRSPDHRAKRELRRRVRARRERASPMRDWKRRLKHALGILVYRTRLYRIILRRRAVIALFHRVDDRLAGNPLSCTAREFEAFADFFRKYFEVISMRELLTRLEESRDISGTLVITFDDGYRDNRVVAAPLLESKGLTACFFVATGFIGSSSVPWWDAEIGIASEWMTWAEVRELAQLGFEVGAHTINHADLGEVEGDEAREEIGGSRLRLERELGRPVDLFSYPYGRRDQITEANRVCVREAGFRCCLSAFGGIVKPDASLFELPRVPVSPWFASPYHFGFEVLFGAE